MNTPMISQFHWSTGRRQVSVAPARSNLTPRQVGGWLLLILISGLLAVWLAYRLLVQPPWLSQLPELLREGLDLVQAAALLTLAGIWLALIVRQRLGLGQQSPMKASLAEMRAMSPKGFEHFVGRLFRKKGYRVVVRGRSGDHGVDLELRAPSGKRAIVQCKRYQNTVGEDAVRELFGTLIHERAARAFLVTTAEISGSARDWASGKPISLIDGPTLARIAASLE